MCKYCLFTFFCDCIIFTSAFTMGLSSMSMTTSPWAAAIIATTKSMKTGYNKPLLYIGERLGTYVHACVYIYL